MTDDELRDAVSAIAKRKISAATDEQQAFVFGELRAGRMPPRLTRESLAGCGPMSKWWSQWCDPRAAVDSAHETGTLDGAFKIFHDALDQMVAQARRTLTPEQRTLVAIEQAIETREILQ